MISNIIKIPRKFLKKQFPFYSENDIIYVFHVDGMNFFVRTFLTNYKTISNVAKKDVGQIIKQADFFLGFVKKLEQEFKSKWFLDVVLEKGKSVKHKKIDQEYKKQREIDWSSLDLEEYVEKSQEKDQFIYEIKQFRNFLKILNEEGFLQYHIHWGIEGDFILQYNVFWYQNHLVNDFGISQDRILHVIVSQDKDFLQFLTLYPDVKVIIYNPVYKKYITPMNVNEILPADNITQEQFQFMRILVGDPSDNIKGVKGIGQKRQLKFIEEINLSEVYKHLKDDREGFIKQLKETVTKQKEGELNVSKSVKTIQEKIEKEIETVENVYKMIILINPSNLREMISFDQLKQIEETNKLYVEHRLKMDSVMILSKFMKFLNTYKIEGFFERNLFRPLRIKKVSC